jgi:hypothetical protein
MLFGLKKENRCTEWSRVKIHLSCKSSLPRERFQGSHLPFLSQACFQMLFTIDPCSGSPRVPNYFPVLPPSGLHSIRLFTLIW